MLAEVILEPVSLDRAASGAITGRLALRIGDAWFPDPQWHDVPVVVLARWLRELIRPLSASGAFARCGFMEGPVAFRVVRQTTGGWSVVLVEGTREHPETEVDGWALIRSISTAADRLLAECARRGWRGEDVEDLRVANEAVSGYRTV
jgi:hypothetical protein